MHQVMLLWHAYLKVYHNLKGNWHQSITTLLPCWEDLKKYILAVKVYCEDFILILKEESACSGEYWHNVS